MNEISISEYGGKGYALEQLRIEGFNVPRFIVLPVSFFRGLGLNDENPGETIIAACAILTPEWDAIFSGKPVAVRSSAVAEDSAAHSFAGQFKTLLGVSLDKVSEAVAEVWLSAKAAHVYASAHGIATTTEMAVILQEMVDATAAGVAFSAHPVNGTEQIIINAVPGLGGKLVDGSATADTYEVVQEAIMLRQSVAGLCVLNDVQILQAAMLAARAHKAFRGPQDIEFAFCSDALFILQSRPITTLPTTATIWDNSNIVESYPGLTGPLTFSFIEKMYEAVYQQFSALLGVTKGKIARHAHAFANMLGLLNGRVYYNLNSWYDALALLPGYSINSAFMERMMGVKEKPAITVKTDKASSLKAWWEVLAAAMGIIKNLAGARSQAKRFGKTFNRVYDAFASKNFGTESLPELWTDYQEFETLMVREWKAPLVNDFFAMVYFGLLQKLCAGLVPEDSNLHNRLLAGSEGVLTTQPMKELPRIAAAIADHPELLKVATSADVQAFYTALQQPEYALPWKLFSDYIAVWGERSVAELKLETITYQQDPLLLARLLQSYLRSTTKTTFHGAEGRKDRHAAEVLAAISLQGKWRKRVLFNHVLRNARYFVTQRENLRYYRTRGFGMVRRMMLAIGAKLSATNIVASARDVFWLKLEEIEPLTKEPRSMHEVISQRKNLYLIYEAAGLPQRLTSYGVPKGIINLKPAPFAYDRTSNILQGIPCSAGIVRAQVRLVNYSDDLKSLEGAILATYATDPGFVVLFTSASGILTERGSLLSHAAIVSREMGIPCIVGIDGLMERLKDGDVVEMDGSTGRLTIIEE